MRHGGGVPLASPTGMPSPWARETELMTPGAPAESHAGQGTQGLGERRPLSSLMAQGLLGQLPQGQYKKGTKQNKSREEPKADSGQSDSERPQGRP